MPKAWPNFDLIWAMCAKHSKPVMIHIIDSYGRFLPIGPENERQGRRTDSGRRDRFPAGWMSKSRCRCPHAASTVTARSSGRAPNRSTKRISCGGPSSAAWTWRWGLVPAVDGKRRAGIRCKPPLPSASARCK